MPNTKNNIREYLKHFLIPIGLAFLSLLGSDKLASFLLTILPKLQELTIKSYLRIILPLLVFSLTSVIVIVKLLNSKPFHPNAMKGKKYGIPWSAVIDYSSLKRGHDIQPRVNWFCPKHKTRIDETEEHKKDGTKIKALYCGNCQKYYYLKYKNTILPPEEVRHTIADEIQQEIDQPLELIK